MAGHEGKKSNAQCNIYIVSSRKHTSSRCFFEDGTIQFLLLTDFGGRI